MSEDRIFINYRRADTRWAASRLFDDLGRLFGRDRLFMDVDSIPAGEDFVAHLNAHVDQCAAILVLIGPDWLTPSADDGGRRIDDPADFVKLEIARALERGVAVVPVLVDGAPMPTEDELPERIKPLCRRQALRIGHETYRGDLGQIEAAIAARIGGPARSRRGLIAGGAAAAVALAIGGFFFGGAGDAAKDLERPSIVGAWIHAKGAIDWQTNSRAVYDWNGDQGVLNGEFDGRTFSGMWREEKADKACPSARDGSRYWGRVEFVFDADLGAFEGRWGYCDDGLVSNWNGRRR